MGPAMGQHRRAARHAEERCDQSALFGHQRAAALGRRGPARLPLPELADLQASRVARRQRDEGRARHHHRLCQQVRPRRREGAGRRGRRRPAGDPVPQALQRLQRSPMRGPARRCHGRGTAATSRSDRAQGRGADSGNGHRPAHRRQPGLLRPGARLCSGPAAASLFRAHQLAPHRPARAGALCRKLDYAAWPSSAAVASAVGHAAVRHNQSVSRKASSSSLGR
jgi:hypothetical protein